MGPYFTPGLASFLSATKKQVQCGAKKIAPYFDTFWQTDTEIHLQQNCNKISHLS